jgi:hypothetical protein
LLTPPKRAGRRKKKAAKAVSQLGDWVNKSVS